MIVARLGYLLILGIVIAAGVAIFVVLQRSEADPPSLPLDQVINYSKYGVIDSMSANGDNVKVHFRSDFDTKGQLGNSSHDYQTKLRSGDSLVGLLQTAGVRVNGIDGVRVTLH